MYIKLAQVANLALLVSSALATSWPLQSYKTESFTPPVLEVNKTASTAPGYLFLGPLEDKASAQLPVIMTDEGELVWGGPLSDPNNFKVQTLFGNTVLTYWTGYAFIHGYGHVVVLDDTYKQIYDICPPGLDIVTPNASVYPGNATNPCYLDLHESYITENNTLIATAFNVTQIDLTSVGGPEDGWAFNAMFFEIDVKTQEVLYRWRHFDNLDSFPLNESNYLNRTGSNPLDIGGTVYGYNMSNPWDPFHINSVQGVNGGYLVNSRFYWEFFFVNATTGEVDWILNGANGGDFTLDPDVYFSWEHHVRIRNTSENGQNFNVTLFNNDNALPAAFNGTNQTTGLELAVNLESHQVSLLRKLYNPSDVIFNPAMGSVQPVGNDSHIFVGYGTVPILREYSSDNTVIYQAQFGETANYYLSPASYRTFKQPWTATPYYPPKGVIESASNSSSYNIYMSWNGATSLDNWAVYGSTTNNTNNFNLVTTVQSTGFETNTTIPNAQGYQYFIVGAFSGGIDLRNSTVFGITS